MDTRETLITYRRTDGELIYDEFSFVMDYYGLEDEECDIIEEYWVLESRKIIPYVNPYQEYEDEELEPIAKIQRRENGESGSMPEKN